MSLNLKKILVPLDFSEVSLAALDFAGKLAQKSGAEIVAMTVIETFDMNIAMIDVHDISELIHEKVNEKLSGIQEHSDELKGVKLSTRVDVGQIKDTILNVCLEERVELIVMGTTGASSRQLNKRIMGSNTHRVIQLSNVPVIAVPGGFDWTDMSDVALPLDVTKSTTQKVDTAINWAKAFGSTVHLVSVMDFFDEFTVTKEKLNLKLEEVAKRISAAGVPVKVQNIRFKSISNAVIDYADQNGADLIIIMTRQENRIEEFFLGSEAREVIMKSRIPVLSMQPMKGTGGI